MDDQRDISRLPVFHEPADDCRPVAALAGRRPGRARAHPSPAPRGQTADAQRRDAAAPSPGQGHARPVLTCALRCAS